MKIGIVLNTNDPETVYNALRLGVTALASKHEVKTFLLGAGVEIEGIDGKEFDIKKHIDSYLEFGGEILACGTCLTLRQKEGSNVCPISSMADLLKMVEESDRVITFG